MTLRRALLILVALVVVVTLVPVGVLTQRHTRGALEEEMRGDLERAPMILDDRWSSTATVRMMHARDLAGMDDLSAAVRSGDLEAAARILSEGVAGLPETPALFDSTGRRVLGVASPPMDLILSTRAGEMPVSVVDGDGAPQLLALAPVKAGTDWVGAAGGTTPMDDREAQTLSGLTNTEVVIVRPDGMLAGSSLPDSIATSLTGALVRDVEGKVVTPIGPGGEYLATAGAIPGDYRVFFLKDVAVEMAIVPELRRSILISSALALGFATLLGALFATAVARPVGSLAEAAASLTSGDVDTPLPGSGIREVERLSASFREMRERLAARLTDLETANAELEDRQTRLASLQAELIQRERSLATGQLVSQLAHEIRNPIASIRNCLEVIVRESEGSEKTEEFATLAIEELLRMHELTEQMLAIDRPDEPGDPAASPVAVAREVGRLLTAGDRDSGVSVVGAEELSAAIPREGLKQVLLNLMLNAREASGGGAVEVLVDGGGEERVTVQVLDRGPGIDEELLSRVFDPFFTTKDEVHGVGLGLFIAEAIVRRYEGSISAENRDDGPGARFIVTLRPTEAM